LVVNTAEKKRKLSIIIYVSTLVQSHRIRTETFAFDTHLELFSDNDRWTIQQCHVSPAAMSCLTACLGEIKAWMSNNFLQLNSSKTEALLVGTPHQVQSSSLTHL